MVISRCITAGWRSVRGALLGALVPAALVAQAGRISGTVTDSAKAPLLGAQIGVVGTRMSTTTDANGRFAISGLEAGTYDVRVQRIGQQMRTVNGVAVRSGEDTRLDVTLARAPLSLAGVVVSASRRAEKVTDAPATITSIGTEVIDNAVGNNFAGVLKEVKGIDFIQVGMTTIAINARGFNSSFNNRMLMTEDGRISVLPENGLPVGTLTVTPKVDLASIEVLVGPGSALYGPDASNGVLALTTKDPRAFKGATIELTGGNRNYRDVQARYANVFGNFGFKVAGEYQEAKDFENYLYYNAAGTIVLDTFTTTPPANVVKESALKDPINWNTGVIRGTGALVYYRGDQRLELSGGMSQTDGVGQTNVGRNQLRNWDYNVFQGKYSTPHWYFNAYRAQSQSGTSFALNRYAGAQLTPANATLSADSLRKLSDWPSDGRMYAAEAQGNYTVSPLLNTTVVFGAQYRNDVVSSDRQWLWDRITNEDVSNSQTGIYAQTTTPVARWLDVVLAGRLDDPENYDKQWSPKAGVVVKPTPNQAFRVTFNRAFKSPTILQTNFFIPDWTSIISIYGNTGGFQTTNAAGTVLATYQAMRPETNKTWEFGYKGILADRLYLDGTYFRSDYQNFMSPLTIVGNRESGEQHSGELAGPDRESGADTDHADRAHLLQPRRRESLGRRRGAHGGAHEASRGAVHALDHQDRRSDDSAWWQPGGNVAQRTDHEVDVRRDGARSRPGHGRSHVPQRQSVLLPIRHQHRRHSHVRLGGRERHGQGAEDGELAPEPQRRESLLVHGRESALVHAGGDAADAVATEQRARERRAWVRIQPRAHRDDQHAGGRPDAVPGHSVQPVIRGIHQWMVAAICAASTMTMPNGGSDAAPTAAERSMTPGRFVDGAFTSDAGTRRWRLWVPSGYDAATRHPLVVMLHGCTQDPDDLARGTRATEHADRRSVLVLLPEQPASANVKKCWSLRSLPG